MLRTHRPRPAAAVVLAALLGVAPGCDRPGPETPSVFRPSPQAAALIRDARARERAGRLPEALALYESALEAEPRLVDARVRAGELARRTGHPEEAAREAEAVLDGRPEHAEARLLLARALARTDPARAHRELTPVLAARPDDARVRVAAAEIALGAGDASAAMAHLRRALAAPYHAAIRLETARAMASAGFFDDALEVAREVVDREDRAPDARYTVAWILEEAERYPECVRAYRELIRDHPDYPPPYRNLGALMARDGELPRAIRLWERGLEHAPDDEGLRANVDRAMQALGLRVEGGPG
jgi:tetratricopeptide (TPR) repeat protein